MAAYDTITFNRAMDIFNGLKGPGWLVPKPNPPIIILLGVVDVGYVESAGSAVAGPRVITKHMLVAGSPPNTVNAAPAVLDLMDLPGTFQPAAGMALHLQHLTLKGLAQDSLEQAGVGGGLPRSALPLWGVILDRQVILLHACCSALITVPALR